MKKQCLSLIAASLMLGSTPRIIAGPELASFIAFIALSIAPHCRQAQEYLHKEYTRRQTELTTMFANGVLENTPHPFAITILPNINPTITDLVPCYTDVAQPNEPSLIIGIKIIQQNGIWTRKAFYIKPEQLFSSNSPINFENQMLLEQPITPTFYSERFDNYKMRFDDERTQFIDTAKELAHNLFKDE